MTAPFTFSIGVVAANVGFIGVYLPAIHRTTISREAVY
jgi:hypothetical protein